MIINADVMDGLSKLDDCSVQTCVTSPPYWGLRDYGTAHWEGGDPDCTHQEFRGGVGKASAKQVTNAGASVTYQYRDVCYQCGAKRIDAQIGLEHTPEEYVARMVQVFREVRRVLKDDGTLWLNLGDCYAINGDRRNRMSGDSHPRNCLCFHCTGGNTPLLSSIPEGLKPKDLVGIPWRVAFALQADGWFLRQDIIWHKPNPMPESVRDRCTKAHEYIFLLSKQARYYWDQDAVKEPVSASSIERAKYSLNATINPDPHDMRHGNSWQKCREGFTMGDVGFVHPEGRNPRSVWTVATQPFAGAHFAVFPPKLIEPCILAGCPEGGLVLDPFCGSGTTGVVALRHGRRFVGIELNAEYVEMAHRRIQGDMPLFNAAGGHHIGDANEMVQEGNS